MPIYYIYGDIDYAKIYKFKILCTHIIRKLKMLNKIIPVKRDDIIYFLYNLYNI